VHALRVFLLGRFHCETEDLGLIVLDVQKAQELLAYLLMYRDRPHNREVLAGLLWSDQSGAHPHAKRNLRQTLWQLQTALHDANRPAEEHLISLDGDWLQINAQADLWLDVAVLEAAHAKVERIRGRDLDEAQVRQLQEAVALYHGDLLEGWYQDWCGYERERFQFMYLTMLDKLLGHCEVHGDYADGVTYGMRILRYDQARETTHRRLMRLHYRAGHRTQALHQYDLCVAALNKELNVGPADETVELYRQISTDHLAPRPPASTARASMASPTPQVPVPVWLTELHQIEATLGQLQAQIAALHRSLEA